MDEKIHYLSVLIELQLYPTLRIYTEGNFTQEELDREQLKTIIQFINELPEEYRKIPNRDEIIARVLKRMNIQTSWVEKKIEEIEMTKKQKEKSQQVDYKTEEMKQKSEKEEK